MVVFFNSLHFLFLSSIPISFFSALYFGPGQPGMLIRFYISPRPILCCHGAQSHDGPRITDI